MNENINELKQSYEKYITLLKKFFPESLSGIERLEADLGERMFLAPRDLKKDLGGYPGGLIEFSLLTAKHCRAFEAIVNAKKLARVSLIHELGKLGDSSPFGELFIPEDSSWRKETLDKHYKYNEACFKMSSAHRTLYYLAKYNIAVDTDEWVAIATSSGFQYDENRFYANETMPLAQALQTARTFAFVELKNRSN